MTANGNHDDLPPNIRRRLGLPTLSATGDALRQAAHDREAEARGAGARP